MNNNWYNSKLEMATTFANCELGSNLVSFCAYWSSQYDFILKFLKFSNFLEQQFSKTLENAVTSAKYKLESCNWFSYVRIIVL
jgi:hypothetical protein